MLASILADRDEPVRHLLALQLDANHAVVDAIGILDRDAIVALRPAERDREPLPLPRNARIDAKRRADHRLAEDALDVDAVHPRGRSRVPRPASSSVVRGLA